TSRPGCSPPRTATPPVWISGAFGRPEDRVACGIWGRSRSPPTCSVCLAGLQLPAASQRLEQGNLRIDKSRVGSGTCGPCPKPRLLRGDHIELACGAFTVTHSRQAIALRCMGLRRGECDAA